KREVENVARHGLLVAKYEAVARHGYANIEHEPRFPDLGLAREDGDSLRDEGGEDHPHRLELLRLKFARGNESIAPRLPGKLIIGRCKSDAATDLVARELLIVAHEIFSMRK